MDSPDGQVAGTGRAVQTRTRLLRAAAELIARQGWGTVTTRAIAERAGLPHGSVSYHFRGKQELLTEAASYTIERLFPLDGLRELETPGDLLDGLADRLGGMASSDPVGSRILMEAMREAERNPALRRRLAAMLADYRRLIAELLGRGQGTHLGGDGPSPAALASVIIAVGDGLLLHLLVDPELDVRAAVEALGALLRREPSG